MAYYAYIHTKVYTFYYMWYMGTGENIWSTLKCIFLVIRRTVLGPGVCLCIRIRTMMHYVHTGEVVVTSQNNDIFLLVTTRLIAHSGQSQFFPKCVGEFSMDTG